MAMTLEKLRELAAKNRVAARSAHTEGARIRRGAEQMVTSSDAARPAAAARASATGDHEILIDSAEKAGRLRALMRS